MKVVRGYKTELDLNDAHRTACMKHAGAARFSYNWGLARSVEAYRTTDKRPTAIELHRELNALIAIEDLHVAGMLKNHHLAQAVSDSNFGEIRRQLEYKAVWRGVHLVTIDRFYPSSKTCSACGWIAEQLDLSVRTFVCQTCGLVIDRDLNAAMNLVNEALRTTGSFSESHACGQGSSGTVNGLCETPLDEAGTNQQHGLSISV